MAPVGLNRSFWRGRRVFITGHTGFKGSWLLLMLRELGAEVHGYSLDPPTNPSMFELLGLASLCNHRLGDVRDLASLSRAFRDASPEIVFHLAAQPLVRASYDDPVQTYATNIMGTVNLLEACRGSSGLRSIVVVTTDKCYENFGWSRGYHENDRLGGADPYSNSKAAAELVVGGYRSSFFRGSGTNVASARAGNVFGGGDFAVDRIVPDAMRAFIGGHTLRVRNPNAIRPWQHVLDPLVGYLMLAERLCTDHIFATGWNFGPDAGEAVPVRLVVEKLQREWGNGASCEQDEGEHPHEAATLTLDSAKARMELKWEPRLTFGEGLCLTAAWFRAWQQGADMLEFSRAQVCEHLQ